MILLREYRDTPLASLIIQDVSASPDLREATVYYVIMRGAPRKFTQDKLAEEEHRIRRLLAAEMRHLKFVPHLHFRFDETAESVVRLEELLDTLSRERAARSDDSEA